MALPEGLVALMGAMAADPVLFCNVMLPKKPHPGQVKWLQNSVAPVNTLVPGNRWGKSTIIAEKHIWKNWARRGVPPRQKYETISVAHSADQALIVFNEAKSLLVANPLMAPFVRAYRETPFPHIIFSNGSVMHCRSAHDGGKYIDGHAYRYLSIDEAGWIAELKNLMTNVVIMRLAGGGEIDLVGTPKGYNDLYFYYDRGAMKMEGYYSQKGSIYDNPYLPADDIKVRDSLLMSADPRVRAQVLEGDFVDYEGMAFTRDQRENAFREEVPFHQDYIEGHRYVTAWDLGRTTDFTVGVTLDITKRPWVMVDFTRLNKVSWEEIYNVIDRTMKAYHCRYARIDATGPQGDIVEEELFKRKIYVDAVKVTTSALKVGLITSIQNALDEGRETLDEISVPDEHGNPHKVPVMEPPGDGQWGLLRMPQITQLMDEMGVYKFDDKHLVTDSVFGLALAVDLAFQSEALSAPLVGGMYG